MARRIRDRWHNSTPDDAARDPTSEKTLIDQAGALAFIAWRQALSGAINLHAEDFVYTDDRQRIAVISEMLAFQIQLVDRLSFQVLRDDERKQLLISLTQAVADHMQDNMVDIAGPGNYRPPFIALMNERFADYAGFDYNANQPGYDVYRFLALQILGILGEDQINRWVVDQIIDLDGPKLTEQISKSYHRLFALD